MARLSLEQIKQLGDYVTTFFKSHEEEAARGAFQIFDLNQNSKITIDEITEILDLVSAGRYSTEERKVTQVQSVFASSDANGDGVLDLQEFITFLLQMEVVARE